MFAGRVKIVSHSSCRASAILKYFCPLLSYRNLIIGLSFWPVSADLIDLFSDAFGPRGEKLNGKQTKFSGKNHQIEPSSDRNP